MKKNILRDAKRVLKAIMELYDEDTAPVQSQKRLIMYLTKKGK
jgi:hypothetical protein